MCFEGVVVEAGLIASRELKESTKVICTLVLLSSKLTTKNLFSPVEMVAVLLRGRGDVRIVVRL